MLDKSNIEKKKKKWVSSYGPECFQSIKLQDSLRCNIVRTMLMMKFVFCMQINIKIFCKVILSFWVSETRHAQSTQNKFVYLFNISIKAWMMKLIFDLQKMTASLGVRRQTGPNYQKQPSNNLFALSQGKHQG